MISLLLHITCLCIFHAYIPSFLYILILIYVGAFLRVSFFLSLSLSFVSCSMAPKWKFALSQNPLHFRASSSSSPTDSTPSHVRFRGDNTRKDFYENFS